VSDRIIATYKAGEPRPDGDALLAQVQAVDVRR
jgi:hypothetical protein